MGRLQLRYRTAARALEGGADPVRQKRHPRGSQLELARRHRSPGRSRSGSTAQGRRWVVVHISILSPRDIERIVRMGLVLTSHTNSNIYKEGHTWQARLPRERQRENTPLRDLIDAGVKVGLITDNVPISLFWPIWESVARLSRVTNERIAPEQSITRAEALRCATLNGAYLTFDEDKKGSLEPGKLADLAVLSADPLTVPESAIRDITSDITMVGGKIVHQVPKWVEV